MVDLKSATSPNAAIAALLAMDDSTRARTLSGLRGLRGDDSLDSFLAGLGARALATPGGARLARRVKHVQKQLAEFRAANGNLSGLGSWLSEAIHGVTNVLGPVIGGITGGTSNVQVPTIVPSANPPTYTDSWYSRNDPNVPYYNPAAASASSSNSLADFGILAMLSQFLNGGNNNPSIYVPSAVLPSAATASSGTVFGMRPEIAAIVALGVVALFTMRR